MHGGEQNRELQLVMAKTQSSAKAGEGGDRELGPLKCRCNAALYSNVLYGMHVNTSRSRRRQCVFNLSVVYSYTRRRVSSIFPQPPYNY